MNSYPYGTTIRLECVFRDFEGNLRDPELVKVKIYDYRYNILIEESGNKQAEGTYFFDYVTPDKAQQLFYEWYGEIEGKPTLKRGEFSTRFM